MVEISTSGSERAQGEIPWATYSDPSTALHEARNGVSHSVASCALQLGHSCGFKDVLKPQMFPICGVAQSSKWRVPFRRIVRLAAGPHLRFQGTKWVA